MKIVVGLGNPGVEYERTRHNVGFVVLDTLARRHASGQAARGRFHAVTLEARLGEEKAMLLKPTTFMNRSGLSVGEAVRFFKVDPAEDLLVVVDDVALPCGDIRLRASGSAGGHNGLADIERSLGGADYARLRIGVDAPGPVPQKDYVLGRFTPEQQDAIAPAIDKAADATEMWAREGVIAAMNRFNARAERRRRREREPDSAGDEATRDRADRVEAPPSERQDTP